MSNDQSRPEERPIDDASELVRKNGLAQLFANRVRARIFAALFYAEKPLTTEELAAATNTTQTVVYEALDQLTEFRLLERVEDGELGNERYRFREDDELVEAIRTVAERATERYYD